MASNDIGLGAVVSLQDQFSSNAKRIGGAVTKLETNFGLAAGSITKSAKTIVAGGALILAGALGVGLFAGPIASATEFQKGMQEVGTLTDQTFKQMQGLSRELITQSITLGQAPIESTKLLYQAISAGATNAEDRLNLMQVAQKGATAGLANQTDVLNLLAASVKSFGLEWKDAAAISDLAFKTVKLGTTTMSELATAMPRTLSGAKGLGIGINELFNNFATLTGVTGNTNEVATQLIGVMAALTKPTSDADAAAKQYGLTLDKATIQSKGMQAVLLEIKDATGGSAREMARFFPRVNSLNAVMALTGPLAGTFAEKMGEMGKAAGATEMAFGLMAGTMAFTDQQITAVNEAFSVLIGLPLLESLKPVKDLFVAMKLAVVEFAQENPALVKAFGTFALGASLAAILVGSLLVLKGTLGILALFAPFALGIVKSAILSVFTTLIPLLGFITVLGVLVKAFKGGEGSLLGGFGRLWERGSLVFRGLTELVGSFKDGFGTMSKETADALKKEGLFDLTVQLFQIFERGRGFFKGMADGFSGMLTQMGDGMRDLFPEGSKMDKMFTSIADAVSKMGLDKTIEDWREVGKSFGSALPMILVAAFALSQVGKFVVLLTGSWKLLSGVWSIGSKLLGTIVPMIGKMVSGFLSMNPLIFIAAATIGYLISRWDLLVDRFQNEGIVGPMKQLLADFIGFVVKIQQAIQKLPFGKKIISDFDINRTISFQKSLQSPDAEARVAKQKSPEALPKSGSAGGFDIQGLLNGLGTSGAGAGGDIKILLEMDGDTMAEKLLGRQELAAMRAL